MVEARHKVVWTPSFAEEVYDAVSYINDRLRNPTAARALLDGVTAALDRVSGMPGSGVVRQTPNGTKYLATSYKRYNIYYQVEEGVVKAIALKHQLRR